MRTDEELFDLCRQRDARAWELIVERYQTKILNLSYQFCGNRDEARDLAQDVFIRLYQTIDHYESGRTFKTWLYSMARNLCIDHYRRRKKDRKVVDTPVDEFRDLPGGGEPQDRMLAKRERSDLLLKALDTLGTISREAIVMKDFQDLSLDEIARTLEVPIGTVKSRISRARVELGKAILRYERPDRGRLGLGVAQP